MVLAEQNGLIDRITELGERAAAGTSVEILEVQLRGAGKSRLLRVFIDKRSGVTHGDCELISERLGKLLDDEDVLADDSYTLEVSSPGVERKLVKARDFERVLGQTIRLVLAQPLNGQTGLEGPLKEISGNVLGIETASGEILRVPLEQVQKAKVKFAW